MASNSIYLNQEAEKALEYLMKATNQKKSELISELIIKGANNLQMLFPEFENNRKLDIFKMLHTIISEVENVNKQLNDKNKK